MDNTPDASAETKDTKEMALHYMRTLIDVAREAFLILDSSLRVINASPMFYESFKVTKEETEGKLLYELGNGQWNIQELKQLLEEVLPEKKEVLNFEVTHTFESIGQKTIKLNAKQIDSVQLIILAMQDITNEKEMTDIIQKHTEELEIMVAKRTVELSDRIKELESLNKTMVGRELKMVELKKEMDIMKQHTDTKDSGQ